MKEIIWHHTQFLIDETQTKTFYDQQVVCHSPVLDCYRDHLRTLLSSSLFFKEAQLDVSKPTRIMYRYIKEEHKYQARILYVLYGTVNQSHFQSFSHFRLGIYPYKKQMCLVELSNVCLDETKVNEYVCNVPNHLSIIIQENVVKQMPYHLYQLPEKIENSLDMSGNTLMIDPINTNICIESRDSVSIWEKSSSIVHMMLFFITAPPIYFHCDIKLRSHQEALQLSQSQYLHVSRTGLKNWTACLTHWLQINFFFLLIGLYEFLMIDKVRGAIPFFLSECFLFFITWRFFPILIKMKLIMRSDSKNVK